VLDGRLLVGIDGIQHFSSSKIHCRQCLDRETEGKKRYHHRALTALVVHPDEHEVLALKLEEIVQRKWNGRHGEIWRYRWTQDVPLRAGDDGMRVNWCEVTITHETEGTRLYKNSFATNLDVNASSVKAIAQAGRARWKHENEGHNVLTTRGYHIKHNFGHGNDHLATVMFTLNLLAFLLHTFLLLVDTRYKAIREELVARRTFFGDIRSLMRYQVFESWEALLHFMAVGLELEPPP